MIVERFGSAATTDCLSIYDGNVGRYFAESEREEFLYFLSNIDQKDRYFAFKMRDRIVACGGYTARVDRILLTWGMVSRNLHGKGLGSETVKYRIGKILADGLGHGIRIDTSQLTEPFYKKLGFKTVGTELDGFGKGIDRV